MLSRAAARFARILVPVTLATALATTAPAFAGMMAATETSAPAHASVVSVTRYTRSYRVQLVIGPLETMLMPSQLKTAKSGEVMVAPMNGQMPTMLMTENGHAVNHHLEVHIWSRKGGRVDTGIVPVIAITALAMHRTWRLRPVVAMYGLKAGPKDYHFGNNVYLPVGRYTVTVWVGKEQVTFPTVVIAAASSSAMSGGSGM